MNPASHFFFVRKPKNSTEKNPFANVVKKHSGKFSVPPEKSPDCFQTVRQSYLISFYHMCTCMQQMRYPIYRMRSHAIAFIPCDKSDTCDIACDKCDIGRIQKIRYLSHMRYHIAYTPSPPPPWGTQNRRQGRA